MGKYRTHFRQGRDKWCHCGSGKKYKNCCGAKVKAPDGNTGNLPLSATSATLPAHGFPGETQALVVFNVRKGQTHEEVKAKPWNPGVYKVQFLLSKPGFPLTPEYNHSFIGNSQGTSHLHVLKPKAERSANDADRMLWWSFHVNKSGTRTEVRFEGEGNDRGMLSTFITEVKANDANDAQAVAYSALAPLLSGLTVYVDVPLHIERIETTELSTRNVMLRILAPFPETTFNLGVMPHMSDDFCHYSSLYREALQSNSPFYRFLCLYKILEGSVKRRARIAVEARTQGLDPPRPAIPERIPTEPTEQMEFLRAIYPWRTDWDEMSVHQIFEPQAVGKSLHQVRTEILEDLRNSIAHALWEGGEPAISIDNMEDMWKVNKWLPLLRCLARLSMVNDFPQAFPAVAKSTN